MLRQTPNRRHRWLAPANSDLESSYESRPGYHTVEVHTQAGPTQVSLHNQAVEALEDDCPAHRCFCTLSNPCSNCVTSGVSPACRPSRPITRHRKLPRGHRSASYTAI